MLENEAPAYNAAQAALVSMELDGAVKAIGDRHHQDRPELGRQDRLRQQRSQYENRKPHGRGA